MAMTSNPRATEIGRVRYVLGSTITVELNRDLAGIAPIWESQLQPVGQIGSLVRIPQGPTSLIATVVLVGISDLVEPVELVSNPELGHRWLKIQLIGEVDALGEFQRGVSSYPGLDDAVHFASTEELVALYPVPDDRHVAIGTLSAAPDVRFSIFVDRLVSRHSAIVGSTGSGKTSAVATLVQRLIRDGWGGANILIIDPHGEYNAAFKDGNALITSLNQATTTLRIPYWALPAADVLSALARVTQPGLIQHFGEAVLHAKLAYLAASSWLNDDPASINVDSPIPYDMRQVWYDLDRLNRTTLNDKTKGIEALIAEGDPATLKPADFEPATTTNTAPWQGVTYGKLSPVPERLRIALEDKRLRFFLDPDISTTDDPLPDMLASWFGNDKPVSILDFSGVPSLVTDLAVGALLNLIFDIATACDDRGIGFPYPVLFILEEAHRYLGSGDAVRMARDAANRIAREGRKYGVGLMLVSQRPSELPETALSQVGTLVALRLTNSADQGRVRTALPDAVAGLADALPSLRNGEAIISGEATRLPSRVRVDMPSPEPDAKDPSLRPWRQVPKAVDIPGAVAAYRREE